MFVVISNLNLSDIFQGNMQLLNLIKNHQPNLAVSIYFLLYVSW